MLALHARTEMVLRREALQPRTYHLELVAIASALGALVYMLL